MLWLRADGRTTRDNAVPTQQFQMDSTVCVGEPQKASPSGVTMTGGGWAGVAAAQQRGTAADQAAQGCMAEKEYLLVLAEQAEAKRAELALIAARKKQETAAATPPAKRR